MPRLGALAIVAVLGLGVTYLFAFTLIGFAGEFLAAAALLALAGQLAGRLWHHVGH